MTEREFQLGDRVRTSFDGEEFPGVYEIAGFSGPSPTLAPGALLESADGDKTWAPVADLHLVTDPQPPLSYRQTNKVREFSEFVADLKQSPATAALTLLRNLVCIYCGARLTTKQPRCHCENDL